MKIIRTALEDFPRWPVLVIEAGTNALVGCRISMAELLRITRGHCMALLWGFAIAFAAGFAWSGDGDSATAVYRLELPAGPAETTLRQFAELTGYQLLYRSDWLAGVETRAIDGSYEVDRALQLMLQGTGLEAVRTREGVITLVTTNKTNDEGKNMRSKHKGFFLGWFAAGVASALAAADGAAEVDQRPKGVLEEVVVTAQKTSQNLHNVPMSVNAISERDFADSAGFEFTDIDRLTAGLDIRGDSFDTDIVLRGVGTDLSSPTSARVTTYLDGAHVGATGGLYVAQYDLARYEVLRGSQGTLYGKASPAGAITIHTRSPSLDQVDGYVKQSLMERDGTNTQFGVSLPVVEDVLGVRIAGVYDYNGNSDIENRYLGEEASKQTRSGRATFLLRPDDRFQSRLSYQYTEYSQDYFEVLDGNGPIGSFDYRDREAAGNVDGLVNIREKHAVWENVLDLGGLELTAVSFYQEQFTARLDDRDITPAPGDRQEVDSNYSGNWNQELRLSSHNNDFWDYIVGVYYSDSDASTEVGRQRSGGFQLIDIDIDTLSEDWGVFAHNTFKLTPATTLTAGLRWTQEERFNQTTMRVRVPAFGVDRIIDVEDPEDRDRTFRAWTGTIKLQHDLSDDVMVYGGYDRGFRAGSNNISSGTFPPEFAIFDEETSHSFEVGLKARLLDGAAEVSMAAYYQIYDDFHYQADNIPVCEEVTGGVCTDVGDFSAVVPAEEVVSQGVEVEGRYLVTDNWSVFGSISYNDTRFEKFAEAPCDTGSVPDRVNGYATCDAGGEEIGAAPTWSGVFSSEYSAPLAMLGGNEWFVRGLYNFNGSVADPASRIALPGFGLWDMFAGLRSAHGGWELSVWAKNIFDKDALLDSSFVSAFPDNYRAVRVTDPRTLGVSGSYRW